MEAKSKQEDYQSKLARDMHKFYHSGGNGFNAYGGNNHGNGNFTPKRHNRVGNISSYAKSYGHTSYDDYRDYDRNNAKYDYYKHINELPQVQEAVEESIVIRVVEETSNEDSCDNMNERIIEKKEECNEIKEKERVENKKRLVERSCVFNSISILSKESV
ncbi:hypothetical protein M9H77_26692 [Catharanthus roseus]|uniref:Uncharacterized protein n=1 Tax=Catharanthus roseus TaxID=4058 RepID=A0ACC0ACJ5_CATRO|nr:hypothetical protein M9H77_26692 [Catharanthus roseus]